MCVTSKLTLRMAGYQQLPNLHDYGVIENNDAIVETQGQIR